jgi:hypothetical protein
MGIVLFHDALRTSLYTHISIQRIHEVVSPLDLLRTIPLPAPAEQHAQG